MKFWGRLKFWNFLWLVRRVSWVRVGQTNRNVLSSSCWRTGLFKKHDRGLDLRKIRILILSEFGKIWNRFQKVSKDWIEWMQIWIDYKEVSKWTVFRLNQWFLILNTFFHQKFASLEIVWKVSQTVKFEVNALRVYSESVRYSNSKTRVKIIKYDFEQSVGSYNIVNYE